MFIQYQIKNGNVTEEHLLNCNHIIRAKYVPAYTKHVGAGDSDDGEEHTYSVKSHLRIVTTEIDPTTTEMGDEMLGASTQSMVTKLLGNEADNIWALLVVNANALQPF